MQIHIVAETAHKLSVLRHTLLRLFCIYIRYDIIIIEQESFFNDSIIGGKREIRTKLMHFTSWRKT